MKLRGLVFLLLISAITLSTIVTGCASRPLLYDVTIRPDVISPNADGEDDVARISYKLSRKAGLSIYLVDAGGHKHYFRKDKSRIPGDYFALFGGTVDNKLLPDGQYTCVVEATEGTETVRREKPLLIRDGDMVPLKLTEFTVYPETFTPNRDGINDRVSISYYLNKDADVKVYLLGPDGEKYPIPEEKITKPGVTGSHEHDYEGGVDLGATPPADGTYTVVAEAVDSVGNRVRAEAPLTIVGGGVPRAEIVNRAAVFAPLVVPLGGTLTFTATVENIGTVPIRTKGPEPGMTYTTSQNFNTLGFYEEPGIFRLGVDFEGNSQGRKYPYRWQLGRDDQLEVIDGEKYLMPGQRVTIVGHIQIIDKPPKINPDYWVGLIHEQVEIVNDWVEVTEISVGF